MEKMQVIISPGTGPINDTTEDYAIENIKHFITDLELDRVRWLRISEDDDEGRYAFLLWRENYCCLIDMPGLSLENVRWMSEEQNIWHFPRLYVNGSSWVWRFALSSAQCLLTKEQDND